METWFVVVLLINVPLDDVESLDMVCSNDFFSNGLYIMRIVVYRVFMAQPLTKNPQKEQFPQC